MTTTAVSMGKAVYEVDAEELEKGIFIVVNIISSDIEKEN